MQLKNEKDINDPLIEYKVGKVVTIYVRENYTHTEAMIY